MATDARYKRYFCTNPIIDTMTRTILSLLPGILTVILAAFSCTPQDIQEPDPNPGEEEKPGVPGPPDGKQVYIPKEFKDMNLLSEDSRYCWKRSFATEDIIIFWEKGFGDDLSAASPYKGHEMTVDLARLSTQAQGFYALYKKDLNFIQAGSKADKYRMMVMLQYDDDGTAYGGSYDDVIGALWVTPLRTHDMRLNAIAHELGHSFQFQLSIDGNTGFGSGGVYEMTSQWMLWQTNPAWYDDEVYHWDALLDQLHLAFMHPDNMYHTAHVFEAWSNDRGQPFMADLWRAARKKNDVVKVYEGLTGMSHEEFCDEQFQICRRLATFDFDRVREACARYSGFRGSNGSSRSTSYGAADADGWRTVSAKEAPQQYGFNRLKLKNGQRRVGFRSGTGGWRYGFVGIKADGTPVYSPMFSAAEGEAIFDSEETFKEIWFLVMAAPSAHQSLDESQAKSYKSYTYKLKY